MRRKVTNVACYIWSLGAIKNTLYSIFLEFVFVPFKLNKNGCICHSCEINVGKSCCTCLNFEARADTERRAYLHWNTPLNSIKQTVTWLSCNVILFNFSFRQSLPPSWFKILRSHGHICQGNKLVSLHQWNWR